MHFSPLQLFGVVGLVGVLALSPLVLMSTTSDRAAVRNGPAETGEPPQPAGNGSVELVPASVPPAAPAEVEPVVRVIASSAANDADDDIVVEIVDPEPGSPVPEIGAPELEGVPELEALSSMTGNVMLRVRWNAATTGVLDYRVVCDQTEAPPAWVQLLVASLDVTGYRTQFARLETTTTGTEVYFNNAYPLPGAEYRCSVTPRAAAGTGEPISASVVAAPLGFDPSSPGGPPYVQSVLQGTMVGEALQPDAVLHVLVTADAAGLEPITGSPYLAVECTDIATGRKSYGGVGGGGPYVAPVRVGDIAVGHTYSCVAASLMTEVSAPVVMSGPVVAVHAGVPPAPASVQALSASYGRLQTRAVTPAGLTPGLRLGVRVQCTHAASGVTTTVYNSEFSPVGSALGGDYFQTDLVVDRPGTWTCALAFTNEHGAGPTRSMTVTVGAVLSAPTGMTVHEIDGSDAVLRVAVPADAWSSEGAPDLVVACRDLATGDVVMQSFPIADLIDLGGGIVELRVPVSAGATYRCEHVLRLFLGSDELVGRYGAPVEFSVDPPVEPGGMSVPEPPVALTPDPATSGLASDGSGDPTPPSEEPFAGEPPASVDSSATPGETPDPGSDPGSESVVD